MKAWMLGSALIAAIVLAMCVAQEASAATFNADAGSLGAIPDATACGPTPGTPKNVTFTVSGISNAPASVDVGFTATHAWVGDLIVTLIAPNGATQTIFGRTLSTTATGLGDSSDLGGTYVFSDAAPTPPSGGWWQEATARAATEVMTPGTYRATATGGAGATNPMPPIAINPTFAGIPTSNGTWTLRFTDGCTGDVGNVSAATLSLGDTTPPAAPNLTATDPPSPSSSLSPKILGSAEAGSQIKLYTTADCSGPPVATDTAAALGAGGIQASVSPGSTTQFRATATDASANVSPCSAPINYSNSLSTTTFNADAGSLGAIPDATACGPTPGTPKDVTFTVSGISNAPTSVDVGFTATHGWVGDLIVTLIAPNGATQTILGRTGATNATSIGDSSDLGGAYVFSDNAPSPPSGGWWQEATARTSTQVMTPGTYRATATGGAGATNPMPPIAINPTFAGIPTSNGTWTLRFTDGCTGDVGNVSAATLRLGAADLTPPDPPNLTATDPASPANENSPKILGSAEAGSQVKLYTAADCSGAPAASGTAAALASGIQVSVPDDSTTEFRATATDGADNVSACSAPIAYVEKSRPATPSLTATDPPSPANDNTPRIIGSAEAGTQVALFETSDCSGVPVAAGTAADLAGSGIEASVPDNSTTDFRATATDTAGNVSSCSAPITYAEQSTAGAPQLPNTTIDKGPQKKSKKRKATFEFSSDQPSVTFECSLNGAAFTPCKSPDVVKAKKGANEFAVRATAGPGLTDASPAAYSWKVKKKRKHHHHHHH
jgi:subtilisin-like proprotein convertase family protein